MPDKPHENKVKVTFTVNNQDFTDDFPVNQKFQVGAKEALRKLGESTNLSKWTLTLDGKEVSFDATYADAGVKAGARLLLTRKPGNKA